MLHLRRAHRLRHPLPRRDARRGISPARAHARDRRRGARGSQSHHVVPWRSQMADGAVVQIDKSKPSHHMLSTAGGIVPTTFEETWRIAEALSKSSLVRKDFQGKPENVMLVLMQG